MHRKYTENLYEKSNNYILANYQVLPKNEYEDIISKLFSLTLLDKVYFSSY